MKIAIFGAGAMGSVYAARFAEAGFDVIAIDSWAEHVKVIACSGLRLEGPDGDRVVSGITASSDAALAQDAKLFVIATKAAGVSDAARAVRDVMAPQATVLTIQNICRKMRSSWASLTDSEPRFQSRAMCATPR